MMCNKANLMKNWRFFFRQNKTKFRSFGWKKFNWGLSTLKENFYVLGIARSNFDMSDHDILLI